MRESAPEKVGRYRILSKLGAGAMGAVYRAEDPTIRRSIALKVIPVVSDPASGPELTQRGASLFEREAQAAGALLHPGIVTLHDAGRDGDWYYLAMELIEGETFADEMAREEISPQRAASVGAAVAEALHFAHQREVVHRDIKPANLMILPDRSVKVADFGIARLQGQASTMTSDQIVGTPAYMSPEQIRGEKLDGRTDLYALAVVLYEAVTGSKPFAGQNIATILNRILNDTVPRADEVNRRVPRRLAAVIAKAMSRKRDDRYADGLELAAALRAALGDESGAPRKRRWRAAAVGAALGLVAVGATHQLGIWAPPAPERAPATKPEPAAPPGYIRFRSTPEGATVRLDGRTLGKTPFTSEVAAGSHEVVFQLENYFPWSAMVTVESNERVELDSELYSATE